VYNLISWESIKNTPDWIEKQIPLILSKNAFRIKISFNTYDAESITQAYCYLVSGVCFSLALKYAGTWNEQTANIIVKFVFLFNKNKTKLKSFMLFFFIENLF
jgi:anaphase-promoting complex subunit 1